MVTKIACRVCGKEYEPCRTAIRNPNVFHWQEVACSPECGAIYLRQITESRKPAETPRRNKRKKEPLPAETVSAESMDKELSASKSEGNGIEFAFHYPTNAE